MFLLRRTIEVRHMHQRRRLLLDRAEQMGMAVAQDVDRDADCEIQKTLAALVDQIATVAAHGTYVAPGIDGHQERKSFGYGQRVSVRVALGGRISINQKIKKD